MGVVTVETLRELDGALLVTTAVGGSGAKLSSPPPFAFERAGGRFIACLCDGSGDWGDGLAASRVAAREAVAVCARPGATIAESITRGLGAANEKVLAYSADELGAACSAVLVVADGTSVHIGWVGSLEAMVLRQGHVAHRTTPHLFALELAASGRFSAEQMADFPHKSTVTRALGMTSPGREPGVDLSGPWSAEPGDLVLLCSAKVHHVLSEADVTALASRDDLAAIVRGLVTTTSTRGDFFELCAVAIRVLVP